MAAGCRCIRPAPTANLWPASASGRALLWLCAGLSLALVVRWPYLHSTILRDEQDTVRRNIALGAQTADVVRMLLRSTLVLVGEGIMIGTAGALAVTRVLAKFLFEVKPNDPPTIAAVALTLVCAALVACYIPARRAMRVDPMVALRHE